MIVTFQGPDVATVTPAAVTLAPGWSTRESPTIEDQEINRDVDVAKPVHATEKVAFDEGGRSVELVFSVTRQFTDEATLAAFITDHGATLDCSAGDTAKNGTLILVGEPATAWERHLENAVCRNIKFRVAGVSCLVTYAFTGSKLTTPA